MLRGLLAPDRCLIILSRSVLSGDGATISNNPIFSGISPTLLTFLYLNTRASATKSSSGVIFRLADSLSPITSSSASLSKSCGSTMSSISSMRDCLTISSMR